MKAKGRRKGIWREPVLITRWALQAPAGTRIECPATEREGPRRASVLYFERIRDPRAPHQLRCWNVRASESVPQPNQPAPHYPAFHASSSGDPGLTLNTQDVLLQLGLPSTEHLKQRGPRDRRRHAEREVAHYRFSLAPVKDAFGAAPATPADELVLIRLTDSNGDVVGLQALAGCGLGQVKQEATVLKGRITPWPGRMRVVYDDIEGNGAIALTAPMDKLYDHLRSASES